MYNPKRSPSFHKCRSEPFLPKGATRGQKKPLGPAMATRQDARGGGAAHGDAFGEFLHTLQLAVKLVIRYSWLAILEVLKIVRDLIGLLAMILSMAMPTRTVMAPLAWATQLLAKEPGRRHSAALVGLRCLWLSFLDAILAPLMLLGLLFPTTMVTCFKELLLVWNSQHLRSMGPKACKYSDELRYTAATYGVFACIDTVSFVTCALALSFSPWQFAIFFLEFHNIFSFPASYYADEDVAGNHIDERILRANRRFQYLRSVHFFCLCSTYAALGLKDILLLPGFLVALCLPHRIITVLQDIGALLLRMHSVGAFTPGTDRIHRMTT